MTAKHQSPEWRKTCRIIRAQVTAARKRGDDVQCWRCGRLIDEEQVFDVGHLDPFGGEGVDNAAPEHRTATGLCVGNRNHGGRIGARITNAAKGGTTFQGLPWS